ncbi:hypothetical protein Peur_001777 [Populus x canadensis]
MKENDGLREIWASVSSPSFCYCNFFSGLYSSWDFHVSEAQIRSEYPTNFTSSLLLGSSNTPFPFFIYLLTAV